ncbi:hypothetical protein CHU98_g4305 [Xylaria longipes]|nr:hypothetical protein CHU98_g4305 [Xylaria longipes]
MSTSPTKTPPTLPPVEAVRSKRSVKRSPANHPFSLFESVKRWTGWDRDLVWGPFYLRFRAVRKESANWAGFSLGAIWDGIPAASQTRPGPVSRLFNFVTRRDPAPTITPPPRSKTPKTSAPPTSPKNFDDWQDATRFSEDWSPSQIDFTQWYGRLKHPADYDDRFFTTNYKAIYNRLCDFAEQWFGQGIYLEDWRDNELDISTWQVPMTEQFIQYARTVAHEDKGYVDWKDVINDPKHRKWLCVSIFAQIMERKIFNQLLFGATEAYQKELDRHDSQWLVAEGFTRKEGRRQISRAAVGEHLIPENFWDAVDDLAGQTVLIFQPLFMLMCMATRRTANSAGAAFWQEIHTLLAMAGYFQVCTAVSPSIFHILSATPGVRFQWEEEEHADQEVYEASKMFHRSHEDRWRVLAELSSKSDNTTVNKLTETDDVDSTLYMPYPTSETEYRTIDHKRRRGGKVMYAVFPKLTRYSAENIGNIILDVKPVTSEDQLLASEGMRISLLSRCMVVYYQGLVHDKTDLADGVPLDDHLRQLAENRLTWGLLPYQRYYWTANGKPRFWYTWPMLPESFDMFWFWLLLYMGATRFLVSSYGPFEYRPGRPLWEVLLLRPMSWLAVDLSVYSVIRLYEIPLFDGRNVFMRMQLFYAAFAVLIEFLLGFKELIFKRFPAATMAATEILREEDIFGLARRAVGLFNLNG